MFSLARWLAIARLIQLSEHGKLGWPEKGLFPSFRPGAMRNCSFFL